MTNDELRKALGLGSPVTVKPTARDIPIEELEAIAAKANAPLSESALTLDDWSKRRGREILAENEQIAKSLQHEALSDDQQAMAAADFAAAAYELDPKLELNCVDGVRQQFLLELMDTPQYKALHNQSQLDMLGSELAATSFAEQYGKLISTDSKNKRKGKTSTDGSPDEEDIGTAVAKALDDASEKLDELDGVRQAFGLGGDGERGSGTMDAARVAKLFQVTRNSDTLRRICELAGKYRRVARSKQRQKVLHGVDDIVGVTLTNKFQQLVASELAKLSDDYLELDTVRRVIQRQAMGRERRGVEPVGKGPVVVIIDESGSMGGDKVENAKALALALAWVARQQKRWCALVGYSGECSNGGNVLILPPGKWDEAAICEWLVHFYSGGSDLDYPLTQLPEKYWPAFLASGCAKGKTDVIAITDAIINISATQAAKFNAWKAAENVHQTALIVGSSRSGSFGSICDVIHNVGHIECDSEEIGEILSL